MEEHIKIYPFLGNNHGICFLPDFSETTFLCLVHSREQQQAIKRRVCKDSFCLLGYENTVEEAGTLQNLLPTYNVKLMQKTETI